MQNLRIEWEVIGLCFKGHIATQKPLITEKNAFRRLQRCKQRLHGLWSCERWFYGVMSHNT